MRFFHDSDAAGRCFWAGMGPETILAASNGVLKCHLSSVGSGSEGYGVPLCLRKSLWAWGPGVGGRK